MPTAQQISAEQSRVWRNYVTLWEDAMAESDRRIKAIQQDMLESTTQHLIEQGKSPDEAKAIAYAELNAPPKVPLPTLEELDG